LSIVDAPTRGEAAPRRRNVEVPAGARVSLEMRFAPTLRDGARVEVRTPDGEHFYARNVSADEARSLRRGDGVLAFGPNELGLLRARVAAGTALAPIQPNLAAGRPAIADESDPAGLPEKAIDGDPKTFWRGLNVPPQIQASWAVDLGEPVTIDRVQVDFECVSCGAVRLRLTYLSEPLPPTVYAKPGSQQEVNMMTVLDRMGGAVVGQTDLEGTVADRDTLAAAPSAALVGVRTVVATLLEAPENVGLYEIRLGGTRPGAGEQSNAAGR
jgi:hypothetical protein